MPQIVASSSARRSRTRPASSSATSGPAGRASLTSVAWPASVACTRHSAWGEGWDEEGHPMKIVGVTLRALSVLRSYHTIVAAPTRTIPPADAPPTRSHFLLLALHADNGLTGLGEVSDYKPGDVDVATLYPRLEEALRGVGTFDQGRLDADVFPRYPVFGDALGTAARAVENPPTTPPGLGTDRIVLYSKLQTWTLKAASRRHA